MAGRDTRLTPTDLAACIVKGAAENDLVRLHGAIDAALQLYAPVAASDIFAPALKDGGRLYGPACAGVIATAVRRHLDARKPTTGAQACPHRSRNPPSVRSAEVTSAGGAVTSRSSQRCSAPR